MTAECFTARRFPRLLAITVTMPSSVTNTSMFAVGELETARTRYRDGWASCVFCIAGQGISASPAIRETADFSDSWRTAASMHSVGTTSYSVFFNCLQRSALCKLSSRVKIQGSTDALLQPDIAKPQIATKNKAISAGSRTMHPRRSECH